MRSPNPRKRRPLQRPHPKRRLPRRLPNRLPRKLPSKTPNLLILIRVKEDKADREAVVVVKAAVEVKAVAVVKVAVVVKAVAEVKVAAEVLRDVMTPPQVVTHLSLLLAQLNMNHVLIL